MTSAERILLDAQRRDRIHMFVNGRGCSDRMEDIFELIDAQQLGAGSLGEVVRATDKTTLEPWALKLVSVDRLKNTGLSEARLKREVAIMHELTHPNIVCLVDVLIGSTQPKCCESEPPYLCIVMEYLADAEPLSEVIRRGGSQPALAWKVLQQLIGALSCMHSKGIVHRDVWSENVLLNRSLNGDSRAVLVDFGSAEYTHCEALGHFLNLPYMSPEATSGEHQDPGDDVWAAGILLAEVATGAFVTERLGVSDRPLCKDQGCLQETIDHTSSQGGPKLGSMAARLLCMDGRIRPSSEEVLHEMTHAQKPSAGSLAADLTRILAEVAHPERRSASIATKLGSGKVPLKAVPVSCDSEIVALEDGRPGAPPFVSRAELGRSVSPTQRQLGPSPVVGSSARPNLHHLGLAGTFRAPSPVRHRENSTPSWMDSLPSQDATMPMPMMSAREPASSSSGPRGSPVIQLRALSPLRLRESTASVHLQSPNGWHSDSQQLFRGSNGGQVRQSPTQHLSDAQQPSRRSLGVQVLQSSRRLSDAQQPSRGNIGGQAEPQSTTKPWVEWLERWKAVQKASSDLPLEPEQFTRKSLPSNSSIEGDEKLAELKQKLRTLHDDIAEVRTLFTERKPREVQESIHRLQARKVPPKMQRQQSNKTLGLLQRQPSNQALPAVQRQQSNQALPTAHGQQSNQAVLAAQHHQSNSFVSSGSMSSSLRPTWATPSASQPPPSASPALRHRRSLPESPRVMSSWCGEEATRTVHKSPLSALRQTNAVGPPWWPQSPALTTRQTLPAQLPQSPALATRQTLPAQQASFQPRIAAPQPQRASVPSKSPLRSMSKEAAGQASKRFAAPATAAWAKAGRNGGTDREGLLLRTEQLRTALAAW